VRSLLAERPPFLGSKLVRISQKVARRPLPLQKVIRILREVTGKSREMPAVTGILRHPNAQPA
jgi:hypothetical protein